MAEKVDAPKTPPTPQNAVPPERPKVPENRLITGEAIVPDRIDLNQRKK
jgi:hypothetical protein